jgi:hypothetical protein
MPQICDNRVKIQILKSFKYFISIVQNAVHRNSNYMDCKQTAIFEIHLCFQSMSGSSPWMNEYFFKFLNNFNTCILTLLLHNLSHIYQFFLFFFAE